MFFTPAIGDVGQAMDLVRRRKDVLVDPQPVDRHVEVIRQAVQFSILRHDRQIAWQSVGGRILPRRRFVLHPCADRNEFRSARQDPGADRLLDQDKDSIALPQPTLRMPVQSANRNVLGRHDDAIVEIVEQGQDIELAVQDLAPGPRLALHGSRKGSSRALAGSVEIKVQHGLARNDIAATLHGLDGLA